MKVCGFNDWLDVSNAASEFPRGHPGPAVEGADETFFIQKSRCFGKLLKWAPGAQQQRLGTGLTNVVFE